MRGLHRYLLLLLVFLVSNLAACSPSGAAALPAGELAATPEPGVDAAETPISPIENIQPSPTPTLILNLNPAATGEFDFGNCHKEGGRIETARLQPDWMRYPQDVRVYLPPCYDERMDEVFPVLYLFHGQSYTDDQWERLGVGLTADRLVAAGELPEFLVVMPRDREWTPSNEDPLGRSFMELVVPWVETKYRVIPDRDARAVGGLSRGAGWAVHFGLKYVDHFSVIGAHSPALFWNDGPMILEWLDDIPPEDLPRIWIDLGEQEEKEIIDSAKWFETQLTKRNIPHEWYLNTGFHDEKYWSDHVEQYLRWYAEGW